MAGSRAVSVALAVLWSVAACGGAGTSVSGAPVGDAGADSASPEPTSDGGATGGEGGAAALPLPPVPFHTQSRFIVDKTGHRFKFAGGSWYGAESTDHAVAGLDRADRRSIARTFRELGFNSVRLPWSNELVEQNPLVDAARLSANPDLVGKRGLEILDEVIAAIAHEGLVVILDNHVSKAGWCCTETDGNGLWSSAEYPESKFVDDWKTIVARYRNQPAVVAAELRNELRGSGGVSATWGTGGATDWRAEAERAGNAVLSVNPELLIWVGGLSYSQDFSGPYSKPLALAVANRLVYTPHDYAWFHPQSVPYADLKTTLGDRWGFLLSQNQPFTAPVVVTEFGTCNTSPSCVVGTDSQAVWFQGFTKYLTEADIDWMMWPLNGTEATGDTRTLGAPETYGVLDPTWSKASLPELAAALRALVPAHEGP